MSKFKRDGLGNFIDAITRCRQAKALETKARRILAMIPLPRLLMGCLILIVGLLVGDFVLVVNALSGHPFSTPHYSKIRLFTGTGKDRREVPWSVYDAKMDSLRADPRWKELDQIRPGLEDTLREIERMDSAMRHGW